MSMYAWVVELHGKLPIGTGTWALNYILTPDIVLYFPHLIYKGSDSQANAHHTHF